jgi:hypothetical protein
MSCCAVFCFSTRRVAPIRRARRALSLHIGKIGAGEWSKAPNGPAGLPPAEAIGRLRAKVCGLRWAVLQTKGTAACGSANTGARLLARECEGAAAMGV